MYQDKQGFLRGKVEIPKESAFSNFHNFMNELLDGFWESPLEKHQRENPQGVTNDQFIKKI